MSKYILQPDGTIFEQTDNGFVEDINIEPKPTGESISKISIQQAEDTITYEPIKSDNSTREIEKISSFGFEGESATETITSHRQLYSFTNSNNPFASEFEILTGQSDTNDLQPAVVAEFIALLTAEAVGIIAAFEGIIAANKLFKSVDAHENYQLIIGDYVYTEYDVFTRYISDVINYPKDKSSLEQRLLAYFIGLTQYIAADRIVDWEKLLVDSNSSILKESIEADNPLVRDLIVFGLAFVRFTLDSLASTSSVKRISALKSKFNQQNKWRSDLVKAKPSDDNLFGFFADAKYYNTKFIIERMHVGLKIYDNIVLNKTYLDNNVLESPLTRVQGGRLNKAINKYIGSEKDKNYKWSYTKSNNVHSDDYIKKAGQTTRIRALPQLLQMNNNILKSAFLNGKESLDLGEDITQNFYKSDKKRIPIELVNKIENILEAEYMPFYFHDLRTNEILAFHAFIESISDSFNPEYSQASGFGRIDDVKSYVKTTRNINLSFTLAATSDSDHDLMWYQINKIVAMCYPQWSDGYAGKLSREGVDEEFIFPFTQVPTASPLIRLRVGDVIKSNYSRTNLSRLHGIGDREVDKSITIDHSNTGKVYEVLPGLYEEHYEVLFGLIQATGKMINLNKPVVLSSEKSDAGMLSGLISFVVNNDKEKYTVVEISEGPFKGKKIRVDASKIVEKNKSIYSGERQNIDSPIPPSPSFISNIGSTINVANPDQSQSGFLSEPATTGISSFGGAKKIMKPFDNEGNSNNPITGAYESGMSRGLAGFLTQLDVGYSDSTWETSRIGSKAPIFVKLNINFAPIHDIPPGVDHNGNLRAPVYNVGRVNNQLFGDPLDGDNGSGSGLKDANSLYNLMIDYQK